MCGNYFPLLHTEVSAVSIESVRYVFRKSCFLSSCRFAAHNNITNNLQGLSPVYKVTVYTFNSLMPAS